MNDSPSNPLPDKGAQDALYLIDVSSFIFRAYYSVGYLTRSDGTPTGAVFGVANMLTSLFNEYSPTHVAVAMDSKTPTFRKEIFPEYKANRPPPPDDLKVQFPFIRELVEAFDLAVLQCDGYEADDLIATAVKVASRDKMKVVIVSADKDLMQLVGPGVTMLDTMKNKIWDEAAVTEKWGVPPKLLGDLLAMAGDSSDNIPGVPRVGPKTAAPMLREFGGLEQLLSSLDQLKSKAMSKRLEEHAEDARMSRRLVALDDSVPIYVSLEATLYGEPSSSRLGKVLDRFELHQLKERLFGVDETYLEPEQDPVYRTVSRRSDLMEAAEKIRQAGRFAVDLETTSVDAVVARIVGVALSWEPYQAVYVPVAHTQGATMDLKEVLEIVGPLLEDPEIEVIAQNVKYEDTIFRRHGVHIANVSMDPMIASYLLRSHVRAHNLDILAKEILHRKTISYNEVTEKSRGHQLLFTDVSVEHATKYAGEDAEIAFALAQRMRPMVDEAGMTSLLMDVEIPLARVLCTMELNGVAVDVERLAEMSKEYGVLLTDLERQAHELAGKEFNLASPKQLQEILFTDLGLPTQKKIKTGYSTDSEVLEALVGMSPLPGVLIEHRLMSKLKNTYLDTLPRLVNSSTGRIHASFNQAVTTTGRLSSSNPNLQNIPVRTERGRDIRRAFVASPGHVILSADYSQIELRVLAHLSGDPELTAAFASGEDVHARTARAVFGYGANEEVGREQRAQAKTINFGVIYGKTEFSLAKELGISRAQAKHFIDSYFDLYGGVARFMDETIEQAGRDRAVFTLLGRKRELRDITASNHNVRQQAQRMARNTPIQGTAADLLKLAMIRVDQRLASEGLSARMIMAVHDELVFEVRQEEVARTIDSVRQEMEAAMDLCVPLVVDTGTGENWAQAH